MVMISKGDSYDIKFTCEEPLHHGPDKEFWDTLYLRRIPGKARDGDPVILADRIHLPRLSESHNVSN
jgi:hypothetical protein